MIEEDENNAEDQMPEPDPVPVRRRLRQPEFLEGSEETRDPPVSNRKSVMALGALQRARRGRDMFENMSRNNAVVREFPGVLKNKDKVQPITRAVEVAKVEERAQDSKGTNQIPDCVHVVAETKVQVTEIVPESEDDIPETGRITPDDDDQIPESDAKVLEIQCCANIPEEDASLPEEDIPEVEAPVPIPRSVKMKHTDSLYLPKKYRNFGSSEEDEEEVENPQRKVKFSVVKTNDESKWFEGNRIEILSSDLAGEVTEFLTGNQEDDSVEEAKRLFVKTLLDSDIVYSMFAEEMVSRLNFAEGVVRAAKSTGTDMSELSFALLEEASK